MRSLARQSLQLCGMEAEEQSPGTAGCVVWGAPQEAEIPLGGEAGQDLNSWTRLLEWGQFWWEAAALRMPGWAPSANANSCQGTLLRASSAQAEANPTPHPSASTSPSTHWAGLKLCSCWEPSASLQWLLEGLNVSATAQPKVLRARSGQREAANARTEVGWLLLASSPGWEMPALG